MQITARIRLSNAFKVILKRAREEETGCQTDSVFLQLVIFTPRDTRHVWVGILTSGCGRITPL